MYSQGNEIEINDTSLSIFCKVEMLDRKSVYFMETTSGSYCINGTMHANVRHHSAVLIANAALLFSRDTITAHTDTCK